MKVENEVTLPTTKLVTVMLLEPYAGKLARTVLRGGETGNRFPLPDSSAFPPWGCLARTHARMIRA